MEYKLKRGQALVITGPQGREKNLLARQIAAHHGTFTEIDAHEIETPFGIGRALTTNPETLIVDGFPEKKETIDKIKAWITGGVIVCQRKYQESLPIDSPNIIFLSGDADSLQLTEQDKQFAVISLGNNVD